MQSGHFPRPVAAAGVILLLVGVSTVLLWSFSSPGRAGGLFTNTDPFKHNHLVTLKLRPHEVHPMAYTNRDYVLQRPRFLLFGDSLTERGFGMGGWAASLAHTFYRKVDVVNRGFGGYNTRWARSLMDDVFADVTPNNTLLVTLFFGANDAARPDGPPGSAKQHVAVGEYRSNLKSMVERVRATGVTSIVLLTPPPVHDAGRKAWQRVKSMPEDSPIDRTLDFTAQYARACCEVAAEMGVPCVDLFNGLQQTPGWQEAFFNDGLHFTPEGNQALYDALIATLDSAYPKIKPDLLPLHFPNWDVINATNPDSTFAAFKALRAEGPHAVGTVPLPAAASNSTATAAP